jgi:hypothetical protein
MPTWQIWAELIKNAYFKVFKLISQEGGRLRHRHPLYIQQIATW